MEKTVASPLVYYDSHSECLTIVTTNLSDLIVFRFLL